MFNMFCVYLLISQTIYGDIFLFHSVRKRLSGIFNASEYSEIPSSSFLVMMQVNDKETNQSVIYVIQ
jgi:hypothetical protein